jgi:NADPH-dependent 2,4-dienoyl-CoA reductase/sulfur reductase-like enzyme
MIESCDVAVIGSGPAGLAAAGLLKERGVRVRVLDESAHSGGQLLRAPAAGRPTRPHPGFDPTRRRASRLKARTLGNGLRIDYGSQVLGIFDGDRLLIDGGKGRVFRLDTRFAICATGARERFVPFPGWTLPGVLSTGAAQILLKQSGVLPAADVLVGGTGPLPYLLATEILSKGGRVLGLIDPSGIRQKGRLLATLPWQLPRLMEGARLLASLFLARVPVHNGTHIVEARGRKRLASVVTAQTGPDGEAAPGTEREITTECLAVGFGFAPNIELLLQAGCAADHRPEAGGWVVRVDESLETTVPGVFAAGEVTGIAGGGKSLVEGRLAALSILDRMGKLTHADRGRRRVLVQMRRREAAYGEAVNALCRVRTDWVRTLPADTVICRCEDVTVGEIRRNLSRGFFTPAALKKRCRIGMGPCQGRICADLLFEILEDRRPGATAASGPPSTRPPVKAVNLGALAALTARGNPESRP